VRYAPFIAYRDAQTAFLAKTRSPRQGGQCMISQSDWMELESAFLTYLEEKAESYPRKLISERATFQRGSGVRG
jgi:hypothetical protein